MALLLRKRLASLKDTETLVKDLEEKLDLLCKEKDGLEQKEITYKVFFIICGSLCLILDTFKLSHRMPKGLKN